MKIRLSATSRARTTPTSPMVSRLRRTSDTSRLLVLRRLEDLDVDEAPRVARAPEPRERASDVRLPADRDGEARVDERLVAPRRLDAQHLGRPLARDARDEPLDEVGQGGRVDVLLGLHRVDTGRHGAVELAEELRDR